MRILLSSHGTSLFGAERVLLSLARGLVSKGHEVTIEFPQVGPAVKLAKETQGVGVWVSGRPRLPRSIVEGARFFSGSPAATIRMARAIENGGYDVVWANSIFNAVAATAARLAGVPLVWHIHERNFRGAPGLAACAWINRCADIVVSISDFVARSLDRAGLARKIRVIPNALSDPIPVYVERPARSDFVIGYVGQFEPRKRAQDVVGALARLPFARAIMVGDGKAKQLVTNAIQEHSVAERVTLTGFQQHVKPFYAQFDCVVIPSRDEPFGLVALEAMAAGRPVVAARSGALPEVLGDAALYYPLGDVTALAECVRRLREEPELMAFLRDRGLRRVQKFSMATMMSRIEEAAREAIHLRRPH